MFKQVINHIKNIYFMLRYSTKIIRWNLLILIVEVLLQAIFPAIIVLFPQRIIDSLTEQKQWRYIVGLLISYVLLQVCFSLTNSLIKNIKMRATRNINLKNELYFDKARTSMKYFLLEDSDLADQERMLRLELDPFNFLAYNIFPLIEYTLKSIIFAKIVGNLHPILNLVILLFLLLNILISNKKNNYEFKFKNKTNYNNRIIFYLKEILVDFDHAKEMRLNNISNWAAAKLNAETNQLKMQTLNKQKKILGYDYIARFLNILQNAFVYIYAAYKVIMKDITLGAFTVNVQAVYTLTTSLNMLFEKLIGLKYISNHTDLLREYMDKTNTNIYNQIKDSNKIKNKQSHSYSVITFENVSFKYPGTDKYVLKDITTTINSNEKIAIVGLNGAGKSTFIKLLCGLYRPTSGKILLDGQDIDCLPDEIYSDLFSVIWQDYRLFPFSILENIVLDNPVDEVLLWKVLQNLDIDRKIKSLPLGVRTVLGKETDNNATDFSGGERQKIAFARALYRNAPVLILDEPTASLDPYSENNLYKNFLDLSADKTAILISHRLTISSFCDRTIVLSNGQIKEEGSHSNLMANKGMYYDMFTKQSMYYI